MSALKLLLILIFALHLGQVLVLLLQQKRQLDPKRADTPMDPLFGPLKILVAYAPIFAVQGWALLTELAGSGNPVREISGLAIFAAGFALRFWAVRTLGPLFTMQIGIRSGHRLVQTGPYRWIRHPSYSGYLLMLVGIGIAYGSWLAFGVPVLETLVFLHLRIGREERMLLDQFGERFVDYRTRTKKLIPLVL